LQVFPSALGCLGLIFKRGAVLVPGMASVYQRGDREFYYAKIRDPRTLSWRGVKTPYRVDSPAGKRNALMWAHARDAVGAENIRLARSEIFATWVVAWLQQKFGYNAHTLARYLTAWAHVFEFIVERSLPHPRDFLYRHAAEYLTWRTTQKRRRGTTINHNTALTEMKVMSRILREAVRREFITANPWAQLGINRQAVNHTPAMTQEEINQHRAALAAREGALPIAERWMTVSFELALHQGIRLGATKVPMERVHLDPRTDPAKRINLDRITIFTKGRNGKPKVQTLPVHPALRGLLLALRAAGARWTCELPPMAAKEWWKFRRDHGLAHLRFHSTRSTLANELARNNVPQQKAMEMLGHKSVAVHQAYLHLSAADVADELGGVDFGTPRGSGSADDRAPSG
jgi:site-specific recombinase XerD